MIRVRNIVVTAVFGLFLLLGANANAEISPGARVGAYFDAESAFVGGEVAIRFHENWRFVPNVEFVFVDNGTLTTFNFDFQYDIRTEHPFEFWAGAGPAFIHGDPANDNLDSDTEFGANLFFGVGFPIRGGDMVPYVQPKLILADNVEFALAFGIRF